MMSFAAPNLMPALPELVLGVSSMVLLMIGVFRGEGSSRGLSWLAVTVLGLAFVFVLATGGSRVTTFGGLYVADSFALFAKGLVLLGSAVTIILALGHQEDQSLSRFEFPILVVLAALGMCMMISANDLMSLYVGIELQSLCLYVLASFRRDSLRSTEAGLKYFVLGALSSGMLLYGCSLIYGFTGTTNFSVLADLLSGEGSEAPVGVIIGVVFLSAGLAFKVSAVPFHMWTPDVYEGAPTPVTAFFAIGPKIAAMALFLRVMIDPFGDMIESWRQIIVFLSIASMVLGAFAAIGQSNIKRLMAYSSIGHMGYTLVGLAAGTPEGVRGVLIYVTIYLAMNAGAFACILCMRHTGGMVEDINDLAGLAKSQPLVAFSLGIFMFSLAGVPLLAGFFAKLYVFLAAIDAHLYTLAVIGVLASVVGAYYYLRIVKIMYFDEPEVPFEGPVRSEIGVVMTVAAIFTLFFWVYPSPLVAGAQAAALALFQ